MFYTDVHRIAQLDPFFDLSIANAAAFRFSALSGLLALDFDAALDGAVTATFGPSLDDAAAANAFRSESRNTPTVFTSDADNKCRKLVKSFSCSSAVTFIEACSSSPRYVVRNLLPTLFCSPSVIGSTFTVSSGLPKTNSQSMKRSRLVETVFRNGVRCVARTMHSPASSRFNMP
eukprot:5949565-Amphidinium_carterae.4